LENDSMTFEAVIGLEVHVRPATSTKLFCSCPVSFEAEANSRTCPVCLGLPGALPVLNTRVVERALVTACAVNCRIQLVSRFDRKHYFYPDLPKGYQITQYAQPLGVDGFFEIDDCSEGKKRIRIKRIHLEEDAGRLVHAGCGQACVSSSIDYNRAGVPLIEIVSEPDMRTPKEAGAFLRGLHRLVQYIGVSDGNMEQGSFRCDANISIRDKRASLQGTKVELKNLNSFRYVERALAHEIRRQSDSITAGKRVARETRLWDEARSKTMVMRGKEALRNYRYFPEPDLRPLEIAHEMVEQVRAQMPELPHAKKKRFIDSYALSEYDAECLCRTCQSADYFEQVVALGADPKQACNWIMGEIARSLGDMRTIRQFAVSPGRLAELIRLIDAGILGKNIAKAIFNEIILTNSNPGTIIENKGLAKITGHDELDSIVSVVLKQYPDQVISYRSGKKKLIAFFVGRVMERTGGRADPGHVNQLLRSKLDA
jgi:aspartyl-tRNA(Asn)/glutamyl-tRNA(Gln) amidotransferase subunit B